jgi:hypothetical protein
MDLSMKERVQSVKTLAQIHRFQGYEDARGARETQHALRKTCSRDRIHDVAVAAPRRTTTPLGKRKRASDRSVGRTAPGTTG